MTPDEIKKLMGRLGEGVTVRVVDECPSTNSVLKSQAGHLPDRYVLIARRQTAGRGRMGRSFYSPEGTGLYMSVLLRPDLAISDLPLLTPAAAVAVCGAVEELAGVRAWIKWVNDIYVDGRKVCGILTESSLDASGRIDFAVIGIGVNISPPPGGFPQNIAGTAGSVLPGPRPGAPQKLAAGILRRLFDLLPGISTLDFTPEYRSRSMLSGRDIWVVRGDGRCQAHVDGVDERCALLVSYPDGSREALSSGEVTVRERGREN